MNEKLYGHYSPTFSSVYGSFEVFKDKTGEFMTGDDAPFNLEITESQLRQVYFTLLAEYVDTPIALISPVQFNLRICQIISLYAKLYFDNLEIVRTATDYALDEFMSAGKTIVSSAANNDSTPILGEDTILEYTSAQQVARGVRSRDDALKAKRTFLRDEFTKNFYNRFKGLFRTFGVYTVPYFYVYSLEDDE